LLRFKFRELESNQRPPGSRPGVTTNSNYPGADSLTMTTLTASSSGRRTRTFVSWFKARQPTPSRSPITFTKSALRELNPLFQPTNLRSMPEAGAFAARPRARLRRRKERESNPQGGSLLDRFRDGCHRQLACPSVESETAAAGIEPASERLTATRLYQHRTPQSISQDGGI
jgi:hypothetical protein